MCLFFKVFWGVILGSNANYEKCDFFCFRQEIFVSRKEHDYD